MYFTLKSYITTLYIHTPKQLKWGSEDRKQNNWHDTMANLILTMILSRYEWVTDCSKHWHDIRSQQTDPLFNDLKHHNIRESLLTSTQLKRRWLWWCCSLCWRKCQHSLNKYTGSNGKMKSLKFHSEGSGGRIRMTEAMSDVAGMMWTSGLLVSLILSL